MAREGVLTALQAALAGLGGGIEGAQQYREITRKQEFEREKEKAAAARQAMLDAAALRREEREAADAGMISASQYTGLSPFDMPGATPRQPLLRQTIGGREMVMPEAKPVTEHRAEVTKALAERQKKQTEGTALRTALANVEIGGKKLGEEQAAALQVLDPNSRSIVLGALRDAARPQRAAGGGKEEIPDWKKRERGAEFLASQTFNPALAKALQTRFARDPNAAQDPEMVAYELMTNKTVKPITPLQRYKPPVQKEKADPVEELIKAGEERNRVKAGGAATVSTPAAAPAPRPAAAPTAAPAKPASLADAAAKQASRAELWDQLKAQNPTMSDDEITARVMREIR